MIAAVVSLPGCVASGLLAFAPLGPDHAAVGAAAGLCGAIVTGCIPALLATSSFVVTAPRVAGSLLLASLAASLLAIPGAGDKHFIVVAMFLCVVLAGVWQVLFGLAGVAKMIRFTPHPVLVGFLNGVAVLIAWSQLAPYFRIDPATSDLSVLDRPLMFALLVSVAALMLGFPLAARRLPAAWGLSRVPPVVVAFVGGTAGYYLLQAVEPDLFLGPTLGAIPLTLVPPISDLNSGGTWRYVGDYSWSIVPASVVLALIATLDSLLALRAAQNVADFPVAPVRDLAAQGVGNIAAGLFGGIAGAAIPSSTMAAYRAGGRTRLVSVTFGLSLLAVGGLAPHALAAIPAVVLAGILLATGVTLFDGSIFKGLAHDYRGPSPEIRRRALNDFGVIALVTGTTVFYSVIAGVVAGVVLAGTVFIVNMSRPVIERLLLGHDIQSKRIRPVKDADILRETGPRRAVLVLEGVLFFGNADDLSTKVKQLFQQADMVALDMRGVRDIDVSGANVLANLAGKSRAQNKDLLFCSVPEPLTAIVKGILPKSAEANTSIKHDLDAALEWMEERSLEWHVERRDSAEVLELHNIDFLSGLTNDELQWLTQVLTKCEFESGDIICREGDEGDRMWLLAKGSVSVRLISPDGRMNLRIASLSRGTTVGEMALVDQARRSATIVADEHVIAYELPGDGFARLLSERPVIASKLLVNLSRELARRLRRTSQDLRSRT